MRGDQLKIVLIYFGPTDVVTDLSQNTLNVEVEYVSWKSTLADKKCTKVTKTKRKVLMSPAKSKPALCDGERTKITKMSQHII